MSDKERLSYAITLDTAQLEASAKRASNEFKSMGGNIENQGKRINAVFENIGKTSKSMSKMTLDFLGDDIGRQRQEMEQAFARIEKMSNEVFGSMSEKARQLAKDIQDDTVMLKQLETMQTALNDTYEKGGISLNEYLSSQARLTVLHEQVSNAISDNEQALRTETATMEVTEDSIVALQAKVSLLTVEYMKLSQAQRDGTDGQAVLKNLTDVQNKLHQATASMQQYARAAGTKFDGLSFSMQQIARELPVLAMSPQMFFMAISNNLPMFADELSKARKEYQALTDAGKSATPVWKRVLSSMLSWQTALVGGITLLTVYGDEIVKWVGSLFTAKKALSDTYQSLDEWQDKVSESAGETLANLERLALGWMQLGNDMQAKERYIIDNKEAIDGLGVAINDVNDAERVFNLGKDDFVDAVMLRAQAAATMELAAEEYKKAVLKMLEADAKAKDGPSFGDYFKSFMAKSAASEDMSGTLLNADLSPEAYAKASEEKMRTEAEEYLQSYFDLIKKSYDLTDEYKKKLEKSDLESTDEMVAGSIEAIEAAIALKNEALKKVTNPEDYRKIQAEIKAEQAKLDAITGKSSVNPQDNKKVKDNQQRLHEELMNLRFQNQQEEIDLMADGAEKKRKQIELDYQREYAETLALEKKWREQSNGELTGEQQVEITRKYKIAEDKYNAGIASLEGGFTAEELTASMNKYLAAYGSYIEKRNAIIAQAEADKEGKNVWEQLSIDEATKRALSDLDIEANRTTSAISKLFGDMKDKTLNDLREINEQGQAALDFLKSGEWDEDKGKQFGISKETFDLWSKSPEKLKDISDALRDNKAAADALSPAYDKVARGLKSIFQAGRDTKTLKQGLSDIQDGMSEMMQIGSFLSDTFSNLGDAFGSDALSGVADGINVAMDAAQSAMSGAQAGAMFGPWGAAAGAAIGMVTSLASSIAKLHDAKNEKRIQQLQEQVDVLEQSYDRLGRSIEKAYSTDASELIEQQNTLLEQQKVLIQQQIREEEDKKKTDENRIKEWKQEIEDINDLIEDNREKSKDVIFGQDVQSAIDDFAQAYADAWTAGNDKAKASKDLVKDMIQQMITEAMKATISPDMERIRDKLLEFWQDSYISGWEQDYIDRMVEDLNNKLDSKYGWADDYFKDEEEDTKREGTKKGIATASQESVDENNARLTTIQGHTYSIMTGMADLVAFSSQALRHLAGIENNTAATNDRLDSTNSKIDNVEKKINKVSGTLDDIQLHGLKIKR
jgi:hypothetical protein